MALFTSEEVAAIEAKFVAGESRGYYGRYATQQKRYNDLPAELQMHVKERIVHFAETKQRTAVDDHLFDTIDDLALLITIWEVKKTKTQEPEPVMTGEEIDTTIDRFKHTLLKDERCRHRIFDLRMYLSCKQRFDSMPQWAKTKFHKALVLSTTSHGYTADMKRDVELYYSIGLILEIQRELHVGVETTGLYFLSVTEFDGFIEQIHRDILQDLPVSKRSELLCLMQWDKRRFPPLPETVKTKWQASLMEGLQNEDAAQKFLDEFDASELLAAKGQ